MSPLCGQNVLHVFCIRSRKSTFFYMYAEDQRVQFLELSTCRKQTCRVEGSTLQCGPRVTCASDVVSRWHDQWPLNGTPLSASLPWCRRYVVLNRVCMHARRAKRLKPCSHIPICRPTCRTWFVGRQIGNVRLRRPTCRQTNRCVCVNRALDC